MLAQSLACVSVCVFPGCAVSLVSPRPGLSHASRDHGSIPLASLWPVPAAFCLCQPVSVTVTAVGFEPTPLRTGAWSQRLRPLGQTVMWHHVCKAIYSLSSSHRCCCSSVGVHTGFPGVSHHSAQVYLACAPVTSAVCMSSPYHPSWPWCRCMIRWQRAIAGPVAGLCFCVCVPRVCSVPCVSAPGPLSCEP